MKTALLMPVLNERDGLRQVLPQIDPTWVDEILFVDGGSVDGSIQIIQEWGHGELIHQWQPGLSNAYWEALATLRGDVIVTFSPDGNSLPEAIPALVAKIQEGYDLVIASRYLPGAGSQDDGPITALGNWMFTGLINLLFGGHYSDSLVMLRAFKRSLIDELPMDTRDPVFEPQMAIRCALQKRKVAEIPFREPRRAGGKRKMSILVNGWAIVELIVREWVRLKRTPSIQRESVAVE